MPPTGIVRRPRLLAHLGVAQALTLVTAPPGFGKTAAVADWARRVPCAAWLSLDGEDDAPDRFWAALVSALRSGPSRSDGTDLDQLGRLVERWDGGPWVAGDDVEFVAELLDAGARSPTPLRIVLDGFEQLRDPEILGGLGMLLRTPQNAVRLVLLSRTYPALPVARLRVEGRLCELHADDLRFTPDEAAQLLREAGTCLDRTQTDLLHARTGGWAAGLRLAALRLGAHPDPDRFLRDFPAEEEAIGDYLATEIMAELSEDEREVLGLVSVADAVPAELAVELSGRDDAADVLNRLAHRTELLAPPDACRDAYRTQELLRSYLAVALQRRSQVMTETLHRRAARWWADRGRPAEALGHARMSGETGLVAELLNRWAAVMAARGEHAFLNAPSPAAPGGPWLLLGVATAHLAEGRLADADVMLRRARRVRDDGDTDLRSFRTAVERLSGRIVGRCDDERLPDDPALAAMVLMARGAARIFEEGYDRDDLDAASALAETHNLAFVRAECQNLRTVVAWRRGDMNAVERATAGFDPATGRWPRSVWAQAARAATAHAALLRGSPRRAFTLATDGLGSAPESPGVRFALQCVRGAARFDLDDHEAGLEEMRQAVAELGTVVVPPLVAAVGALLEQEAALALGHLTMARATVDRLARVAAPAALRLARARQELACGRAEGARAVLQPLLREGTGPPPAVVEAWVVETNAAWAMGERSAARHALIAGLDAAEPMDAVRPFAGLDDDVVAMLTDLLAGIEAMGDFRVRALGAQKQGAPGRPVGFSVREQDVLALLPSLRNLDDIAVDLGVSVNTVKTHLRSIYAKLGVSGRRAAVLAAHGLQMRSAG